MPAISRQGFQCERYTRQGFHAYPGPPLEWDNSPAEASSNAGIPSSLATADDRSINQDLVREICTDVTRPSNLFAAPPLTLQRGYRSDEFVFWEIDHGRLLDESQTREQRKFETWGLFLTPDASQSRSRSRYWVSGLRRRRTASS